MIVADASAVLEALLRHRLRQRSKNRMFATSETLHAPHLLDVEIVAGRSARCSLAHPATSVWPLCPAIRRGSSWCNPICGAIIGPAAPAPICGQQIGQMLTYQDRSRKKSEEKSFGVTKRAGRVLQSVKRQREYLGYRTSAPEVASSGSSMPTLIGAAMIAAAILLSTLISALGGRYVGFESPTEESAWLVDRLTGSVYKCYAPERGPASCEAEIATGSVGEQPKR
jgi:hypothetical protein